jgi:hypothetical protein
MRRLPFERTRTRGRLSYLRLERVYGGPEALRARRCPKEQHLLYPFRQLCHILSCNQQNMGTPFMSPCRIQGAGMMSSCQGLKSRA